MINKKIKRIAFNRAAMTYDDYSVLQKQISLDLFDRLSLIKIAPNFILDLGSGTGENNSGFKNIYKNKNIINYDFSERMLMRAKSKEKDFLGLNKLLGKNNTSYICGDMEHLPIKKNLIDLVWTSSSLQWCNDLNKTFLGVKEILNYGGLFIFSTFGPKTLTELSAINKKLSQNDTVNSFTDMHQIGDMLVANGFSDPVLDSDEYTLTYSNVEKLFVDIKSIGATSSNALQNKGLRGRNHFKRMAAEYDKYKKSGLLPATYEVIYGHAWNMNKNQNFKTFEIKHE